jgi:hypothetical protein
MSDAIRAFVSYRVYEITDGEEDFYAETEGPTAEAEAMGYARSCPEAAVYRVTTVEELI